VRWVPCHHGMARPHVADVRWVPCHHGMARPQVADGGDTLQVWRVAASISNTSRVICEDPSRTQKHVGYRNYLW
jgi:hypothetical protein